MPPIQWHTKLAFCMLRVAESALESKKPVAAASAVLKGFEEIIDAFCARESNHFHDEYINEAWKKRTDWMISNRIDILERWNLLSVLTSSVVQNKDLNAASQMISELRNLLNFLSNTEGLNDYYKSPEL